jgi:hypothetical protein
MAFGCYCTGFFCWWIYSLQCRDLFLVYPAAPAASFFAPSAFGCPTPVAIPVPIIPQQYSVIFSVNSNIDGYPWRLFRWYNFTCILVPFPLTKGRFSFAYAEFYDTLLGAMHTDMGLNSAQSMTTDYALVSLFLFCSSFWLWSKGSLFMINGSSCQLYPVNSAVFGPSISVFQGLNLNVNTMTYQGVSLSARNIPCYLYTRVYLENSNNPLFILFDVGKNKPGSLLKYNSECVDKSLLFSSHTSSCSCYCCWHILVSLFLLYSIFLWYHDTLTSSIKLPILSTIIMTG